MPPKAKGSSKAPNPEPKATETAPETLGQRSQLRFFQTNPIEKRRQEVGIPGLTPAERKTFSCANLIHPVADRRIPLSNKTEREFWKGIAKEGLPVRNLPKSYNWGVDKSDRPLESYSLAEYQQRNLKLAQLSTLRIKHRQFVARRDRGVEITSEELEQEKARRNKMSALNRDLYGLSMTTLAKDPEWDDVVPIPQDEPEGALAQIAYPDEYAEAVAYLRAVMATEECSQRTLRLTERIIAMNPAHYTVWLFRFQIISTLKLSIPNEITWLNGVALSNLKNYQIWNHRQLLIDYYHPLIADKPETVKSLARSETEFVTRILEEDTKNYHVWSYRQYLVGKLGVWNAAELGSTQNLIEDDVRNNSAWSHRFYVVFSDPASSTPDSAAIEHDPKIPDSILDRELAYAREKIALAPQNQSPWNYLQGVLTKGGRKVTTVQDLAEQYVSELGEEDEDVKSSHALDLLAKIYQEQGEKDKARLCLQRLTEKWDPIREGYWKYRVSMVDNA